MCVMELEDRASLICVRNLDGHALSYVKQQHGACKVASCAKDSQGRYLCVLADSYDVSVCVTEPADAPHEWKLSGFKGSIRAQHFWGDV